jgi:hypothetical protein
MRVGIWMLVVYEMQDIVLRRLSTGEWLQCGPEPSAKSPPSRINFLDHLTASAIHSTLS